MRDRHPDHLQRPLQPHPKTAVLLRPLCRSSRLFITRRRSLSRCNRPPRRITITRTRRLLINNNSAVPEAKRISTTNSSNITLTVYWPTWPWPPRPCVPESVPCAVHRHHHRTRRPPPRCFCTLRCQRRYLRRPHFRFRRTTTDSRSPQRRISPTRPPPLHRHRLYCRRRRRPPRCGAPAAGAAAATRAARAPDQTGTRRRDV